VTFFSEKEDPSNEGLDGSKSVRLLLLVARKYYPFRAFPTTR